MSSHDVRWSCDDTDTEDHVAVSALVTGVNPATQELTAQITLTPQGTLTLDDMTPAVDLKLLANNVNGPTRIQLPGREAARFVDYVAFLWAQIIVEVSAIIIAWRWLLRLQKR